MKTNRLLALLAKRFPKRLARVWHDYVGLMVSKLPNEVNRILLCLDFDETILDETLEFKPDLIITHHPFIYGSKVKVLKEDEHKRALYEKLESINLPVYSMHTNFDDGIGGMNDALVEKLGLNDCYIAKSCPSMRIGYLANEMSVEEFSDYAKKKLNVNYGLLVKGNNNPIKKVGIVGGGGSGFYSSAIEEGCDIYISGDISHHTRRDIVIRQFNYLDLPHEIEKIFMPTMEKLLKSFDSGLEIKIIDHEIEPLVI